MKRRSDGLLHFLPRRHIECYLLDCFAIAAFMVSRDQSLEGKMTLELVQEELKRAATEKPFLTRNGTAS